MNASTDVFVRDTSTGFTEAVSSTPDAGQVGDGLSEEPSISADGRYVAFASSADDLVANDTNDTSYVFVRDRTLATTARASRDSSGVAGNGFSARPAISGDGGTVAFVSVATNLVRADTNGTGDIFLRRMPA